MKKITDSRMILNLFTKPEQYIWFGRAKVYIAVFFLFACSTSCTDSQNEIQRDSITFYTDVEGYDTRAVSTFGPINLDALRGSADGFAVSTSGLGSVAEMNNVIVKYNSATSLWGYTGDYFWPINASQNVNFTSYAPAGTTGATLTSAGLTVSAFTPAATPASQIDLLYARPASFNRNSSGTGVRLTFTHLLTQVVVQLQTAIPVLSNLLINSVQISVPNNSGSYNGTSWSSVSSPRTYTLFSNVPLLSTTPLVSAPLLLVPTGAIPRNTTLTINYRLLGIPYSKQRDLSTLTNVTTWNAGYKITYTATVVLPVRSNLRSSVPELEVVAVEEEWN